MCGGRSRGAGKLLVELEARDLSLHVRQQSLGSQEPDAGDDRDEALRLLIIGACSARRRRGHFAGCPLLLTKGRTDGVYPLRRYRDAIVFGLLDDVRR